MPNYQLARASRTGGRSDNQDACDSLALGDGLLLVLADGLGGHAQGGVAARLFVRLLLELAAEHRGQLEDEPQAGLEALFLAAARAFRDALVRDHPGSDAHTTAVVAWLHPAGVAVGHAGDSRCYRLGPEGVRWRSRDHSVARLLLAQGEITQAELPGHPDRERLYRSIGPRREVRPDLTLLPPLEAGECLLLCSDGLWAQLPEVRLAELAGSADLPDALEQLTDEAVERGGGESDNVTGLAARLCPPGSNDREG